MKISSQNCRPFFSPYVLEAILNLSQFIEKIAESRISCCTLCEVRFLIPGQSALLSGGHSYLQKIPVRLRLYSPKTVKGCNALGVHVSTVHNSAYRNR